MKNAATVYLSGWPETSDTYKTMRGSLARIAGVLGGGDPEAFAWHELRYEDVRGIPALLLAKGLVPRTVNKMLSALRGTLESAWRTGAMPDEAYRLIIVKNERGNSPVAGRALTADEIAAIMSALEVETPQTAALIAVFAGAGIRRTEAVTLRAKNFDGARLHVRGKGSKHRSIPVGERWLPIITAWQSTRKPNELMFDFDAMDPRRAVSYALVKFCERHSLPAFTAHDLRRTFGTRVEGVAGIAMAQKLLGHTSIQTTAIYVRSTDAQESAAVKGI